LRSGLGLGRNAPPLAKLGQDVDDLPERGEPLADRGGVERPVRLERLVLQLELGKD